MSLIGLTKILKAIYTKSHFENFTLLELFFSAILIKKYLPIIYFFMK